MNKVLSLLALLLCLTLTACDEWTNPIQTTVSSARPANTDSLKNVLLSDTALRIPVAIGDTEWYFTHNQYRFNESSAACTVEWAADAKAWGQDSAHSEEPWHGAEDWHESKQQYFWINGILVGDGIGGVINNHMFFNGKTYVLCYRKR